MVSADFDFVIVGGGLSGLVLGARLSENSEISVLVIESGPDFRDDPRVNIPAMWSSLVDDPKAAWQFKTRPQDALEGREIGITQGHLLGGSGALNGLAFSAASKANINAWEALGNPGWNWGNLSAATTKSFRLGGTKDANGPLQLTFPDKDESEWPRAWRDTIKALGFPAENTPFSGQVLGALAVPDTIYPSTKQRSYSGNAYLNLAIDRPNFTLWTQIPVNKVLFDKPKSDDGSSATVASGVEYTTSSGEIKTVRALKEVILAAGSINSPRILELSGVGDKNHLDSLGISTIIHNPFVGENLQNHPMCYLNFQVKGDEKGFETLEKLTRGDSDMIAAAMNAYQTKQTGPFAKSGSNNVAQIPFPGIKTEEGKQKLHKILQIAKSETSTSGPFAKALESFIHSVLESPTEASSVYISAPVFSNSTSDGARASTLKLEEGERFFTVAILLAHPASRGSVHITSKAAPTATDNVAIDPKYLSHPLDLEILASHLQYVAETLATTEPLASHLKPGGKFNPTMPQTGSFADIENVKEYVRKTAIGAMHFTGTCSMMPREVGGVVDPELRLYGCSNLRVCDASIIPITPRTNPQATIYGVAERAADIIKSSL
ncbi:putative GMC oxidoreductase [Hypoxylon trugodes]|uniref:putative GMC oxidoreductase n=1 Tax=Hypoxylon trugodes TaxID=326681 RepID=UPI00219156B8|nr:putative GMC oxidoreductase [Hypoxylon trugodes]KAI1389099.1 putative GMC oxidoreductase [Hypoxylon trugodes]